MTNDHRGARYYDLAHGNPISHTHIERDFGGGLEGCSPSMRVCMTCWLEPGELSRTRRVRDTASLPWSPEPRTLNLYRYAGVVWRGETPPSRRSRAGKEEVPPPMTRSNLDRWEDCGEAPQGTSLAQLRSNVLDFRRLKSDARRFRHGTHSEVQGNIGRAHARPL